MANRRQHTIPQFYLRPFLTPGFVYKRGAIAVRNVRSPKRVADRQHYYGREELGPVILDPVNRRVEQDGAPTLRKLIENPHTITADDWVDLSWLLANLWMRTPAAITEMLATYREMYSQIRTIIGPMAGKVEAGLLEPPDSSKFLKYENSVAMTLEELREIENRLKAEDGYLLSANSTFKQLPVIAKCIQQMTFVIIEAPSEHHFITSDRPVVLRSSVTDSRIGVGWGNPDAMASIVLCPTNLLVMFYHESRSIYWNQTTLADVAFFNLETLRFADQEVYSRVVNPEANDWMKGTGRWCQ